MCANVVHVCGLAREYHVGPLDVRSIDLMAAVRSVALLTEFGDAA